MFVLKLEMLCTCFNVKSNKEKQNENKNKNSDLKSNFSPEKQT